MQDIRHSVLMITYNQEELIHIALDSVLNQSIMPYEIIIGDDCSTDKTWQIIQEYYNKYPQIIKPIRHKNNKGIFGNINYLMDKPSGDVISWLSGDDYYKPGIFEEFNKTIRDNNINIKEDSFILISNAIHLYPNGDEIIYNNLQFKDKNLFKVKLRYGLDYRETGIGINVWKRLNKIPTDKGYHADWLYSIDQILKSNDFYFINKGYSVYRIGVGVTSSTKQRLLIESRIEVIDEIIYKYNNFLDKDDLNYLNLEKMICQINILNNNWSLKNLYSIYNKTLKDPYNIKRYNLHQVVVKYYLKKYKLYNFTRKIYKQIKKLLNS